MPALYDKIQMAENVAALRESIAKAAAVSGRNAEDIMLCAVCKTRTSDIVRQSAELDVDLFGENHMQELIMHGDDGAFLNKPVHFIGHLQTNKVKKVVGRAQVIESVDSIRLLEAISKEAQKQNIIQDILFEVNIAQEESKSGVLPQDLPALLESAASMNAIRIRGLMTIPPAMCTRQENRVYFASVRKLFDQLKEQAYPNAQADILSMGMSGSYIDAILEGSTLVRIGTAIYGERDYSNKI